jgi:glyoxylase-like metal-dependent hydrolase (beta-lactamase superfamily II)
MTRDNPFPIVFDVGAMIQGWRIARKLAGGDDSLVIPGHDPLVRRLYPAEDPGAGIIRLDQPPIRG